MDTNDAQETQQANKPKLPVLTIIAIAIGIAGVGFSAFNLVQLNNVHKNANAKLGMLNSKVNVNAQSLLDVSSSGQTEEEVKSFYDRIILDVNNSLDGKLEENSQLIKQQLTYQLSSQLEALDISSNGSGESVEKIVDDKLNRFKTRYDRDKATQTRLFMAQIGSVRRDVDRHDERLAEVSNALSNHSTVKSVKGEMVELKRLKSFNILSSLKDDTIFVIEAPKKNGKINTITLTVGEAFYSAFGSHKVLSAEKDSKTGKNKLRISGNWFIDDVREELTAEEIQSLKASKQARKSKKAKAKVNKVVAKHQKEKRDFAALNQMAKNKIILKDWFVITTMPERQEVVVYSPQTKGAIKLTKNMYVKGIGTVRDINLTTGETCFEKYCVAGLK